MYILIHNTLFHSLCTHLISCPIVLIYCKVVVYPPIDIFNHHKISFYLSITCLKSQESNSIFHLGTKIHDLLIQYLQQLYRP